MMKKDLFKKNHWIKGSPLVLAALLLLTSCGSAGKSSSYNSGYDSGYNSGNGANAPAMAAAGDYATEEAAAGDYAVEEAAEEYEYDGDAAEAAYDGDVVDLDDDTTAMTTAYDNADAAGSSDGAAGSPDGAASAENPDDPADTAKKNLEKIVYTCSADLQTLEYDQSVKDIKDAVKSSGGIIQSETESDNNSIWYYDSSSSSNNRNLYLTVRIPTEKYETFVNSLDQYGKVMNKTQTADNISRTYNDKKTYITSLETEQKRLLEMMDKAETIEDMMAVEARLTEVQRQLNQYKTELNAMDMDVAYSTVTLSLQEVQKINNQPTPRDSFWTRLKKAFIGAWEGFVSFCEDFLFALIYLLPAIVVIALIVWIVLRVTRKKRRARKEKKRAEREMFEDLKRRAEEEKAKQSGSVNQIEEGQHEKNEQS